MPESTLYLAWMKADLLSLSPKKRAKKLQRISAMLGPRGVVPMRTPRECELIEGARKMLKALVHEVAEEAVIEDAA